MGTWVLKKGEHIISKVKTRNTRHQKFGIALPKSVVEAKALDETNGNTYIGYWMNALAKAMKNTY